MATLAIDGGAPEVRGPIARFSTIGTEEINAAIAVLRTGPLSGFLGSEPRGGLYVRALEDQWSEVFHVKHSVAVNSATSGLLIAAQVAFRARRADANFAFVTSPYTMSASAAAPMIGGLGPIFADIDEATFCLGRELPQTPAIITTNLFGHPAEVSWQRFAAERYGCMVIEDNAQAIGAMEKGRYAGTIGHIGVFSLNIHKALQTGEGGIVVTDDDGIADELRGRMNHGEMRGGPLGLNLRMTEVTAAIAVEQLRKLPDILASRRALAERLNARFTCLPMVLPATREGCVHSWYAWACRIPQSRDRVVAALAAEGVPIRAGYMRPLYEMPAFARYKRPCPIAEKVESEIAVIELCSIDPTPAQVDQIDTAFHKVFEQMRVTS